MHFSAKSCVRDMVTIPDRGGVAKPDFFLDMDIKCNFQQKSIWKLDPSLTLGGKSLCHCWKSQFSFKLLRENKACA